MKKLQNKVHLMGKLSLVPETKLLENGRKVVHMTLSTLETYKNETTGLQTTELFYHQLIAWGKGAEIAQKFLSKGSVIAIEGKLVNRSYFDKEGIKRYVTKIEVSEILMVGDSIDEK